MAVVWLKNNINAWNTPSAFAFWNENAQRVEDYNQVPQDGDTFYLNGYVATFPFSSLSIGSGTFRNDENPHTNRSGGHFLNGAGANITIVGNMIVGDDHLFYLSAVGSFSYSITGDISNENSSHAAIYQSTAGTGYWYRSISITGNIRIGNYFIFSGADTSVAHPQHPSITIVGNITSQNPQYAITPKNITEASVIGICNGKLNSIQVNDVTISSVTIVGKMIDDISTAIPSTLSVEGELLAETTTIVASTLNINGSINYKSTNNSIGIRYTTLNVLNPDTFTWKDITEPRSNPFVIVTNADMNNRQQYPAENEVKKDVHYAWGALVGTMTAVAVGCVTKEDVREGVPLLGMSEVGTLVVPSVDDVREGVVFDNGSVGTLIVQGGGDRLRIADFGYYTNAQSDTYIVDLTEQDKPKFAVAEERVLIEMFPDLDLENIPEKYFDDLFVKYLKYRLIVEYYRTAGINSTFTPSEPTTEIVNYQNVRNEVWLNSANIYLKAWGKKYPESIVKPQRILL